MYQPAILSGMKNKTPLTTQILCLVILIWPLRVMAATDGASLASDWVKGPHTRARLVAMPWDGRSKLRLGIQLELEPGWKTYWRNPGDAGIPPKFNWEGSSNIKAPHLLWPAPERMADDFGVSIGYKHGAVLPVNIEPARGGQPVKLSLDVSYGVCADVCIPVTSRLRLELRPGATGGGPHDALITKWRGRVPVKTANSGLDIASVKPVTRNGKTGFEVTLSGKGELQNPAVFVEGPGDYYFSVPKLVSHNKDKAVYRFEVDDLETVDQLRGKKLTFTLRDDNRAAERVWVLN